MLITKTLSYFKDGANVEIRGIKGALHKCASTGNWFLLSNAKKEWANQNLLYNQNTILKTKGYTAAAHVGNRIDNEARYIAIFLDEINNHSWFVTKDKSKLCFGPAIFKGTIGLLVFINICGRETWAFISNNKELDGGSTAMALETEKYKDSFAYVYIIEQSGELIDYVRIATSEKVTDSSGTKYNPRTFEPVIEPATGPIPNCLKTEFKNTIPERKPIIPDLEDEAPLFKRILLTPNKIN